MMLFQPDRIKSQLFPIHGLFKSFFKVRTAFGGNKSKFHGLIPICEIDVAGTGSIRGEYHLPPIGRERWMWMTALIITKCIRIMPAKYLEYLFPIAQVHFRDAAWACLSISDHGLFISVQVVMGVGAP